MAAFSPIRYGTPYGSTNLGLMDIYYECPDKLRKKTRAVQQGAITPERNLLSLLPDLLQRQSESANITWGVILNVQ